MVLTLDLYPEFGYRLRREAENRGIAPEEVAARVIAQNLQQTAAKPHAGGLGNPLHSVNPVKRIPASRVLELR
jgi:hypothetical protein